MARGGSDADAAGAGTPMAVGELTAAAVVQDLRTNPTQAPALDALEAMVAPIPRELALATAPALVDVAAGTEDRATLDRCTVLLARLMAEAAPDPSVIYGAAFAGEGIITYWASGLIVEAIQRAVGTDATELTREDAYSHACLRAHYAPAYVRGFTCVEKAAGRTAMEFIKLVRAYSRVFTYSQCFLTRGTVSLGLHMAAVDERRPGYVEEAGAVRRRATAASDPDDRDATVATSVWPCNWWRMCWYTSLSHRA
eukprot:COSAG06_NODE_16406_length_1003_cov_1.012168_1_plen_253_part_10